ncbi:FkbM family methyltransferase [uncultured Brevundimonas sp.]|uniref:FkbM family methyltransferase n=1 Tax=uncultured Brevundimonas sp. TaxID=213418 RepID=UPI0030EE6E2D|tara:strand:+ start:295 stop:1053 length:759 start_codon:yes stop_codon:yes gene_type:complete
MTTDGWSPPFSLKEKLRHSLIPASLQLRWRVRRALRRGEPELALLPELVDPHRVAIDVGANSGVWSWSLLRVAREVHAFEPNPKMFSRLKAALGNQVHLHTVALSDTAGEAEFIVPLTKRGYSNQHGSLSRMGADGAHGIVKVQTCRLDDLDIRDVGFIKVDVEGFECAVLAGAVETLKRERPVLVVELEERHTGRPIADLIREVESYGYAGSAWFNGRLTPWQEIDLDTFHTRAVETPRYVFNFVFRPLAV